MTDPLLAWMPIDTAPKDWMRKHTFELYRRPVTICNGPAIKVSGTHSNNQQCEAIVCWAQQEGFDRGQEPHWWDLVNEEPLSYAPTCWRPLTPSEEERLDQLGQDAAPGAKAADPPAPPECPDALEARRQAFAWAWRASGVTLASWAERWGRTMWLSGMPEGADTASTLTADMGEGCTLSQQLALDWELNRPSYTRLAAALILQMAKDAGYDLKGNPI